MEPQWHPLQLWCPFGSCYRVSLYKCIIIIILKKSFSSTKVLNACTFQLAEKYNWVTELASERPNYWVYLPSCLHARDLMTLSMWPNNWKDSVWQNWSARSFGKSKLYYMTFNTFCFAISYLNCMVHQNFRQSTFILWILFFNEESYVWAYLLHY